MGSMLRTVAVIAVLTVLACGDVTIDRTVTVDFETGAGSHIPPQAIPLGSLLKEPADPFLAGMDFAGWFRESSFSTAWLFASDTVQSNLTLYAKWTLGEYTVSFNTDGGTAIPHQVRTNNQAVAEPSAPTKAGHVFLGWFRDEARLVAWNFAVDTVHGNMTLHAKWRALRTTKALVMYAFVEPATNGIITEAATQIVMAVPAGTPLGARKASFMHTGVGVAVDGVPQASGVTPNDFTWPVTYTVTAEDGSTRDYTVTVATPDLAYTANGDGTWAVSQGTADTTGLVRIPPYWMGNKVGTIRSDAFNGCVGMTDVLIPRGIAVIEQGALQGCSGLSEVTIPDSVAMIKSKALMDCTGLKKIHFPAGLQEIADDLLRGCSSLEQVILPVATRMVGDRAFQGCASLTNVVMPHGVVTIGGESFRDCVALEGMLLPESLTNISSGAFKGCVGLKSIVIPAGVVAIQGNLFDGCISLESVAFTPGNAVIHPSAFRGCTGLKTVTIPHYISAIHQHAFLGCTGLTNVFVNRDNPPNVGVDIFLGCTSLVSIRVPAASVLNYQTTAGWSTYSNIIIAQ